MITINNEQFTLASLKKELTLILATYPPGSLLKDRDYAIARYALQQRQKGLWEKENPPIKVGIHPRWNTLCFMYLNGDKEWEAFSLKKAVKGSRQFNHRCNVTKAFKTESAGKFSQLQVSAFLELHGLDKLSIRLIQDNGYYFFEDRAIADMWKAYTMQFTLPG